jgi:hypothetical protein
MSTCQSLKTVKYFSHGKPLEDSMKTVIQFKIFSKNLKKALINNTLNFYKKQFYVSLSFFNKKLKIRFNRYLFELFSRLHFL